MKRKSKLALSAILVLTLLVTMVSSIMYAAPQNTKGYEAAIEAKVKEVLENGYSSFYKINNTKVNFDEMNVNGEDIEATVSVKMNTTLKVKKVEELPYVKGMLKKANMTNFTYESKAKTDEAVAKANKGKLKNEKMAKVAKELDFRFNELKQYIDKAADNNFILKITAKVSNNAVAADSIKIMAENIDTLVPVEQLLPNTAEEMEAEGANDMQMVIESEEQGYAPSLYASYNRVAARDYANRWSTNPTSCYDHGTSCGIRQNRTTWNNAANPYYAELCHNDCADFVSQSLHAGGIPMDSTWKRGTPANTTLAWVNTGYLKTYMLTTKAYWKTASFSTAYAGGVLYTASSHVVFLVFNDTVTRKYSAHTNDRNQVNYSNVSGYAYYILW